MYLREFLRNLCQTSYLVQLVLGNSLMVISHVCLESSVIESSIIFLFLFSYCKPILMGFAVCTTQHSCASLKFSAAMQTEQTVAMVCRQMCPFVHSNRINLCVLILVQRSLMSLKERIRAGYQSLMILK